IMIRHNEATELCMTKGQEGKVVGWQEAIGSCGQTVLDTLFVELNNPPRPIKIDGLPVNVVAISKMPKKVWCQLPDDMVAHIIREQVPRLLNFAMTDYSSQGKSRVLNVVDLNNCKTHFSYYTVLSRGTSQEFRELELLNEITELRYSNKLPASVKGINRHELLRSFQLFKGGNYQPEEMSEHIRWKK
ncbi:hypothetical protein B0H10DRAFT_1698108, partial [Mycena sp. CBHHK59/15]